MRTRCRGAYIAAIFFVTAHATSTITVDDGDPSIEYNGAWTHNPWGNQSVNYGSSVTFTNISGSTATYKFQGTAIAVFGAFEMSGTFDVRSNYSIDNGAATEFVPPNTFVAFQYNQKFFQSDTLSDDEHTLVITNLGVEFWLDYLVVTQASLPTNTTIQSSGGTILAAPSTTDLATTSSASQSETVSTAAHAHATRLPTGAIAGLATVGFLVLIAAGLMMWRRRREGRVRKQEDLTPYDPGLTALAFSEKHGLKHGNNSNAGTSMAQSLPTYPQVHVSERGAGEHGATNEIRTSDRNGLTMDPDLRTVFEPMASPLSASPLLARHPCDTLDPEDPPVTHSAGPSRCVNPLDETTRWRCMDGGVRIAGGPPIPSLSPDDPLGGDDDGRSGLSTLPPSYQLYPAT